MKRVVLGFLGLVLLDITAFPAVAQAPPAQWFVCSHKAPASKGKKAKVYTLRICSAGDAMMSASDVAYFKAVSRFSDMLGYVVHPTCEPTHEACVP
jgi:hypothetical protein